MLQKRLQQPENLTPNSKVEKWLIVRRQTKKSLFAEELNQ